MTKNANIVAQLCVYAMSDFRRMNKQDGTEPLMEANISNGKNRQL